MFSATKVFNLLAVSSLAVLLSAVHDAPVAAVSIESRGHVAARHHSLASNSLVKKKRSTSKRCKAKSSSAVPSAAPSSTATSHSQSSTPKATSTSSTHKASATSNTKSTSGSSSSGSSSSGSSSSSSGSTKVGIAWSGGDVSDLKFYKTSETKFLYTWSPYKPDGADNLGFEFMPMLWSGKQVDAWTELVKEGYAQYALGFNEPNEDSQSNMSPSAAASLWKQYIQPLKAKGYKLITPACTNGPSGISWYKEFFDACDGCSFDGLATHFYSTSAQGLIDYLNQLHDSFNMPIWVTEYACQNFGGGGQASASEVNAFFETTSAFMQKTSWVAAYFAFGVLPDMGNVNPLNQLMGSNGQPTSLGYNYIHAS